MYLSIDLPKFRVFICHKHREEMMSFCNSVDCIVSPSMLKVWVRSSNYDCHNYIGKIKIKMDCYVNHA